MILMQIFGYQRRHRMPWLATTKDISDRYDRYLALDDMLIHGLIMQAVDKTIEQGQAPEKYYRNLHSNPNVYHNRLTEIAMKSCSPAKQVKDKRRMTTIAIKDKGISMQHFTKLVHNYFCCGIWLSAF